MQTGLIFDVKRYAINDGPGIRATVFFKGCPLRCAWCHNPESISTKIQKMYNRDKCIGCKACVEVCPEDACVLTSEGIITDRDRCTGCGKCADVCPTMATEMSGRVVTVDEIVETVEKERVFFEESGGGVSFSGGEPLMQPDFLLALLKEFSKREIHRVVDTTLFAKWEIIEEVAQHTDHFLVDLKLMDNDKHREWTGVPNALILENIQRLAATGATINIRIPLVAGVNADDDNIEATARFVSGLAGERKIVNLLPYHNIAEHKYSKLGDTYNRGIMAEPGEADLNRVKTIFANYNLETVVGG